MLQRIQTVYLLIIVALTVATLFLPLAVLQQGDALFSFDASGLSTMIGEPELLYPAWGLFALTAIIAIIALVTIFLYKKRILQIRLCVFIALLILCFYGFSVIKNNTFNLFTFYNKALGSNIIENCNSFIKKILHMF